MRRILPSILLVFISACPAEPPRAIHSVGFVSGFDSRALHSSTALIPNQKKDDASWLMFADISVTCAEVVSNTTSLKNLHALLFSLVKVAGTEVTAVTDVGTYQIGAQTGLSVAGYFFATDASCGHLDQASAESGSVTLESSNPIAGHYEVTFGGRSVSGVFTVSQSCSPGIPPATTCH